MRQIKKVEIQIETKLVKHFTVKELTVAQLIELSQTNSLLGGVKAEKDPEGKKSSGSAFIDQIFAFQPDIEKILEFGCDFKFADLIELAPSDIKLIVDEFLGVNKSFLDVLGNLGILQILTKLIKDFTTTFLESHAT